jgi:hypothetical protein
MIAAENSAGTALPQVGRPWKKGQSGNPGGRPAVAADVKAEARRHTKEALGRLVYWMRSDDPQASIRASMAILDRGCGKPTPTLAVKADEPPKGPIRVIIDPFKDHRELMEDRKREREEQAAIPADTQALPWPGTKDGQE